MSIIDRHQFNHAPALCSGGGSGDGSPGDGGGFGGGAVGTGGAAGTGVGGTQGGFNGGPNAFGLDTHDFDNVPLDGIPGLQTKGSFKAAMKTAQNLAATGLLDPASALAVGLASQFGDGLFGAQFGDAEGGGSATDERYQELTNQLSRLLRGNSASQDLGGGENGQGIFFRNQANARANGAQQSQAKISDYFAQNPHLKQPRGNPLRPIKDQTVRSGGALNAFIGALNNQQGATARNVSAVPAAYKSNLRAAGVEKLSQPAAQSFRRQYQSDRMRTQEGGGK